MLYSKIKSYAKLNLALNVTGKNSFLHKIESIVAFVSLHDEIYIKKIKSKSHNILFIGKFSQNIGKSNSISKLLNILEKKKLLNNQKFKIKIKKNIPNQAGLGGGSMNAASILNYFVKKKIIKTNKKKLYEIAKKVSSDVILGLNSSYSILNIKNEIKKFDNIKKLNVMIVKPNFGCSTKKIFMNVKKFDKPKLNKPNKKMFSVNYLKNMKNSLEPIVLLKYNKLRKIKFFLENSCKPNFVRMTGSGSALVAYFPSKERCDKAKKQFNRKYKNYWCITSKTI